MRGIALVLLVVGCGGDDPCFGGDKYVVDRSSVMSSGELTRLGQYGNQCTIPWIPDRVAFTRDPDSCRWPDFTDCVFLAAEVMPVPVPTGGTACSTSATASSPSVDEHLTRSVTIFHTDAGFKAFLAQIRTGAGPYVIGSCTTSYELAPD